MVVIIIIIFLVILKTELPDLIKNRYKQDLIVFTFLCIVGFAFSVLLVYGVDIKSPVMPIYNFVEKIYGGFSI